MKRRTLVDLLERNLERDPGDAPAVYLEADVMADDMARYAPTALGPTGRVVLSTHGAPPVSQ